MINEICKNGYLFVMLTCILGVDLNLQNPCFSLDQSCMSDARESGIQQEIYLFFSKDGRVKNFGYRKAKIKKLE